MARQEGLTGQERAFLAELQRRFPDKLSRLRGGFYDIKDKTGIRVPFRMNADQEDFILNRHGLDVILKARQRGFCLEPSTRVLRADLTWVAIAELTAGDEVVAVDEFAPGGRGSARKMRTASVIATVGVEREAYRIHLDDGRSVVCTDRHPWLSKKAGSKPEWRTLGGQRRKLKVGTKVRWVTKPWGASDYEDGWFGGLLDGEGSIAKANSSAGLNVSQREGAVWQRALRYASARGYTAKIEADSAVRESKHGIVPVPKLAFGRMDEMFRLIGQCRPSRFVGNRFWEGREMPGKKSGIGWSAITGIEALGVRSLIDLQTTTGTYIAEGFVSHNTTIIQIDMLDDCLFMSNMSAGVIAHNLRDAKAFFSDKIKFAYDNLPEPFRKVRAAEQDSADSLSFNNGSSIRVGVSLRSGTIQRLHVSEYGKLCAKFPDRAEEVRTGAFNTVHVGQVITVESTAEGRAGGYYDLVKRARDLEAQGSALTALDFKFHFYPWWTDEGYVLDGDVPIPTEMAEYFAKLDVTLTPRQRAWYVKKAEQQGDKMRQEFPSTADEAFEASVEGAYFSSQMRKLRAEGRICRVPIMDREVYTTWDLGINDAMSITFWQDFGLERRAIDYYENSGEGFGFYARALKDKGYSYSRHYMPHDADQRRLGVDAKSAKQHAEDAGIKPITVLKRIAEERDGIEASRVLLPQVWLDEERCVPLIACLDGYRREWDEKLGVWKDHPVHDQFSHGYKSFESAAIMIRETKPKATTPKPAPALAGGWMSR